LVFGEDFGYSYWKTELLDCVRETKGNVLLADKKNDGGNDHMRSEEGKGGAEPTEKKEENQINYPAKKSTPGVKTRQ